MAAKHNRGQVYSEQSPSRPFSPVVTPWAAVTHLLNLHDSETKLHQEFSQLMMTLLPMRTSSCQVLPELTPSERKHLQKAMLAYPPQGL